MIINSGMEFFFHCIVYSVKCIVQTENVISCKDGNTQFAMVPFTPLNDDRGRRTKCVLKVSNVNIYCLQLLESEK